MKSFCGVQFCRFGVDLVLNFRCCMIIIIISMYHQRATSPEHAIFRFSSSFSHHFHSKSRYLSQNYNDTFHRHSANISSYRQAKQVLHLSHLKTIISKPNLLNTYLAIIPEKKKRKKNKNKRLLPQPNPRITDTPPPHSSQIHQQYPYLFHR